MKKIMENKKLFYGIAVLFLVGLSLFIWKNSQKISGKCGIENCHGLDIACGSNIPEVCDTMYAAGDNCRQYASCQVFDGKCQLAKTQKFNNCKTCGEKCSADFQDDQSKFFECESKCVGVPCGGWDTFGDVVCECVGQLEKHICPPNTMCDSGTDICQGDCGECKCYQGPAKDGIEIPCDGRDEYFK